MEKAKLLVGSAVAGVAVALIYLAFESLLTEALHYVWDDLFHTQTNRIAVPILTVSIGMVYFAVREFTDRKELKKNRSLVVELPIVLLVGFLSLFAGAALGPEAVLIPAAMIGGQLVAKYGKFHSHRELFSLAGFVALFVAFFNSLLGGLLGFYLAQKTKKRTLTVLDYLGVSFAAVAALFTLALFSHHGAFSYPPQAKMFTLLGILLAIGFFAAGYAYHFIFRTALAAFTNLYERLSQQWYVHGLVASLGLSALFLMGGYLVQFTGNEAIVPIFQQASTIGVWGVVWISLVKVLTIAWSLAMGYRGGLIFPFVFVASSVVAAVTLFTTDFNAILSIFIFLAGVLFADQKSKIITGHSGEN